MFTWDRTCPSTAPGPSTRSVRIRCGNSGSPRAASCSSPAQLYLGVTEEYTETHGFVPFLEGKSSVGRLGIDIHSTAGKGDEGFCNYWTLEMSVKVPVRIYAKMPVGQLIYFEISGPIRRSYSDKSSAKYRRVSSHPTPSRMYLNFPKRARRPLR